MAIISVTYLLLVMFGLVGHILWLCAVGYYGQAGFVAVLLTLSAVVFERELD